MALPLFWKCASILSHCFIFRLASCMSCSTVTNINIWWKSIKRIHHNADLISHTRWVTAIVGAYPLNKLKVLQNIPSLSLCSICGLTTLTKNLSHLRLWNHYMGRNPNFNMWRYNKHNLWDNLKYIWGILRFLGYNNNLINSITIIREIHSHL